jgi:manganese/zinc/iron transport system permease protein
MGMILLTILILFPYYKWMSFDFAYSKVMGMKVNILNLILIFLCSITLIVGFKSVGVVMILALMTFPVLTARLFFHSIVPLLLSAIGINSFASILAVALSRSFLSVYQLSISTSGLLVTILAMLFFLGLAINKKLTKRFAKRIRQQVS